MFRRFTSERVRHQRRKRFVVFSVIYTLLVISLFLFLWQLSYANFFQIQSISIVGEKITSHGDIFKSVRDNLTGAYGHIFSKRNIFLYPRKKIQQDIHTALPSVKKVTLSSNGMHTLAVQLEERKGVAVACRLIQEAEENTQQECYFIDDTAFVFVSAPRFFGSSYSTYEVDMVEAPLGTFIFSLEEFTRLNIFVNGLKKLSLRVTRIRIEGEEMEIVVTTQERGTFRLLVKRGALYEEVARNLESIIGSNDFKKTVGLRAIEYIDLRFDNKVFYKEKAPEEQNVPVSEKEIIPELRPTLQ